MINLQKMFVKWCYVAQTMSPMETNLFEVNSFYITVASNIFKQTNMLIDKGSV